MALQSFNTMYEKMKANGGWKPGEFVMFSGRQAGKSRFMQEYMSEVWFSNKPFERLESEKVTDGRVLCNVNQDIADWLMKEFELGKLWEYAPSDILSKKTHPIPFQHKRVIMRPEVYTALALRWA